MKVALIAEAEWLSQEESTLRRLVVGLVDESVKVVCITPETDTQDSQTGLLTSERLGYRPTRWRWARDRQLWSLRESLREMRVDAIHAMDASLWRIAGMLADALDVPLICSVWSEGQLSRLRPRGEGVTTAYTAASEPLAEGLRRILGPGAMVECIPPGVFTTEEQSDSPPLSHVGESLCGIVVGRGGFDPYYQALLDAIAQVKSQLAGAMYFFHTVGGDQHRLWQAAEQRGLLDEVSLVPAGADARKLLVQADVVMLPQPMGSVHTVVLEAMAAARPVLATPDPAVDHLVEGVTARLVVSSSTTAWARALESLTSGPGQCVELGRSARAYVAEHYKASAFIDRTKALYERVATPEALPFA